MSQSQEPRRSNLVICVDDDRLILDLLRSYVESFGHRYMGTTDARGVLAEIERLPYLPGAFVVDLEMPRMGGLALCDAIRAHAKFASVPIIILTSQAESSAVANARDAGASDYLLKPIRSEALQARLRTWLARAHGARRPFEGPAKEI